MSALPFKIHPKLPCSIMKKRVLLLGAAVALMALASSCSHRTCPTYAKHDVQKVQHEVKG